MLVNYRFMCKLHIIYTYIVSNSMKTHFHSFQDEIIPESFAQYKMSLKTDVKIANLNAVSNIQFQHWPRLALIVFCSKE